MCVSFCTQAEEIWHIIFYKTLKRNVSLTCFSSLTVVFIPSLSLFLTVVKQKEAVEKEAKVSILEAGVTDVSTSVFLLTFSLKQRDE